MISEPLPLTGPTIKRGKSKQDYQTPREFLDAVERRFGKIQWDLAATNENTVAPNWITPEIDSFKVPWLAQTDGALSFLNPPFSNIEPWAMKCAAESTLGARILFLVPASVGSEWFRKWVHNVAAVFALNPRLTFGGCPTPYPKDCLLAYYGLGVTGFTVWRWK